VEEDEDNDGTPPQLYIPKYRLRDCDAVVVTTDLSDLHVYAISPWVLRALEERRRANGRDDPRSIKEELLPLLLNRQFWSAESVSGQQRSRQEEDEDKEDNEEEEDEEGIEHLRREFSVLAHVLPRRTIGHGVAVRSNSIPAYLYACREFLLRASSLDVVRTVHLTPDCQLQTKYRSVLLKGTSVGEKLKLQNSTVGARCKIGARCKLNNVVLLDDVIVGDNCVLQNSVVGAKAIVRDNCSLNDCQIGQGVEVEKGRKLKGESVTKD